MTKRTLKGCNRRKWDKFLQDVNPDVRGTYSALVESINRQVDSDLPGVDTETYYMNRRMKMTFMDASILMMNAMSHIDFAKKITTSIKKKDSHKEFVLIDDKEGYDFFMNKYGEKHLTETETNEMAMLIDEIMLKILDLIKGGDVSEIHLLLYPDLISDDKLVLIGK